MLIDKFYSSLRVHCHLIIKKRWSLDKPPNVDNFLNGKVFLRGGRADTIKLYNVVHTYFIPLALKTILFSSLFKRLKNAFEGRMKHLVHLDGMVGR